MKYTVDYFINKFRAIPENKWTTNRLFAYEDKTMRCALGHCCPKFPHPYFFEGKGTTDESNALVALFVKHNHCVGTVNDGNDKRYKQPSPKQRILAALNYIKKMQQPEAKKEKIVYVAVPVSITEQTNELILN